ncbi:MAG: hypothetical protein HYU25_03030 [Candidatus Rokubacteria bacterium]|nr:hypothetical protein [Candidatus Rokubacteria bacterium]
MISAIGIITFFPRASMSSNATLDPLEPFATAFAFRNDGYQSVREISFACGVNNLETVAGKTFQTKYIGLAAADLSGEILSPNEATEIFCPVSDMFRFDGPAAKIDLDIYVSFSIALIPYRFTRCFRFVTRPDNKGNLRWLQRGFGKKCWWPKSILLYTGPRAR